MMGVLRHQGLNGLRQLNRPASLQRQAVFVFHGAGRRLQVAMKIIDGDEFDIQGGRCGQRRAGDKPPTAQDQEGTGHLHPARPLPPVLTDCLHPNDFDKKTLPQCEVCVTE